MRGYVTFILSLLCCIGAMAQGFTEVSTADGFIRAAKNNENIKLTADIVLPKNFNTINITYKGVIDGSGTDASGKPTYHSVGGGDFTKNSDGRVNKPIFKNLEGATLQNIIISNFRLEWDDDDIGAVAYTAKKSSFINVMVAGISVFNDDNDAGAVTGKAESCEFRNVMGINNDVTVDGKRAGGFVGLSYNSFYCNCSNSAYSSVYADGSWGNAYAGGFVGESNSDQFVFCLNLAQVGALDDCVGGITGRSSKSYFTNCSNSGCIMHSKEADFISAVNSLKNSLGTINLADVNKALEERYDTQDFDIGAMAASFFGGVGAGVIGNAVGWMVAMASATGGAVILAAAFVTMVAGAVAGLVMCIDQEIDAHDDVGGICGYCEGGAFNTCANYGNLICYDAAAGGIVGETDHVRCGSTTITNCLNAGEIKGYDLVGGIFGQGDSGDIINHCLNVGTINAHQKDGKSNPIGCFDTKEDLGTLAKNYYAAGKYDNTKNDRIPVTADMLRDTQVRNLLNDGDLSGNGPWHQATGDEYPVPDQSHDNDLLDVPKDIDGVYIISGIEDLNTLRTDVLNGKRASYMVYIVADIDCDGKDWEPIGTAGHPFSGICFGEGHTISNLRTAESDAGKAGRGFFGVVGINTEVRDLVIGSGSIRGSNGVGAIIGYAEHRANTEGFIKITGCGNKADIRGGYDCGGLIGAVYSDTNLTLTIDNCFNMGTVTGSEKTAAICGFGKNKATVTGCWNSGNVTGTETGMGFARGEKINVLNCYNLGSDFGQSGVESFTEDEAKDGTLCFKLNGRSNDAGVGLPWEQNISAGDAYPYYKGNGEGKAIYTGRVISGNYGTVILPYDVQSDGFMEYYILSSVTGDGDQAQFDFDAVEKLEAGTPAVFLFRGQAGSVYEFISSSYTFSRDINSVDLPNGWKMTGNLNSEDMEFTNSTVLENLYFISEGAIKHSTSSLTVSPFRAYLQSTGPAPTSMQTNL